MFATSIDRFVTRSRLRHVAQYPYTATSNDIRLVLEAHGVPAPVASTSEKFLAETQIDTELVWHWIQEHDGLSLAKMIASSPEAAVQTLLGIDEGTETVDYTLAS